MVVGARRHRLARRGDDVCSAQGVGAEPEAAAEPPHPAPQREPGDAGGGDDAARRGEAERLGFVVEVAPRRAALHAHRPGGGIHAHPAHPREVDHESAVTDRTPGDVVPPAAYRDEQMVRGGEADGSLHVGRAGASGDEGRPPVDHRVPDRAGVVVARVAGAQEGAAKLGPKGVQDLLLKVEAAVRGCRLSKGIHGIPADGGQGVREGDPGR